MGVVPLDLSETSFEAAVRAFMAATGMAVTVPAGHSAPAVALEFYVNAKDSDTALDGTREAADKLIVTLAFRQYGRADVLGVLVGNLTSGQSWFSWAPDHVRRVMHLPFQREEREVIFQLNRIHSTAQGPALARLYGEACGERDATVAVVRFWALLEGLGEQFRGNYKQRARSVLRIGGSGDPQVGDRPLVDVAYDIRNAFMHDGRFTAHAVAHQVREDLREHLYHVLFRVGWEPLRRDAERTGTRRS